MLQASLPPPRSPSTPNSEYDGGGTYFSVLRYAHLPIVHLRLRLHAHLPVCVRRPYTCILYTLYTRRNPM